jgi:hypothetical protein
MKRNNIVFGLFFIFLIVSCVSRRNTMPVSPLNTQVNFNYDDIEYISDVTGTSTQSYLFGIIPIGGRRNHSGVFTTNNQVIPAAFLRVPNRRGLNNALYDALQSKPDADYVIPVSYKIETTFMPFGRKVTLTVRAKAIKIRPKKPEPARPVIEIEKK